jgi:hypothetical protein
VSRPRIDMREASRAFAESILKMLEEAPCRRSASMSATALARRR